MKIGLEVARLRFHVAALAPTAAAHAELIEASNHAWSLVHAQVVLLAPTGAI